MRETRSSEASPACASFALSLALPDARAPGASWARAGATSRSMLRCGCGARAARARLAHLLACVRVSLQLLARALGRAASPFGAPRGSAPCLRPRLRAPRRRARSLRIFSLSSLASCLRFSARIGLTAPLLTTQFPLAPHHERAEVCPCEPRDHLCCIAAADVTLRSPTRRQLSDGSGTGHMRLPRALQAAGASFSSTSIRCAFENWQARSGLRTRAWADDADFLRNAGRN